MEPNLTTQYCRTKGCYSISSSFCTHIIPFGPLPIGIDFELWILCTIRKISWTGGQPFRNASACTEQHKHTRNIDTAIPLVGFELTIPVFETGEVMIASTEDNTTGQCSWCKNKVIHSCSEGPRSSRVQFIGWSDSPG
jgi:hypothetical protein